MKRSTDRFLTTHTGSLPRPDDLVRMMYAKESDVPVEPKALGARIKAAVAEVVDLQLKAGVDLVNDGELLIFAWGTSRFGRIIGVFVVVVCSMLEHAIFILRTDLPVHIVLKCRVVRVH